MNPIFSPIGEGWPGFPEVSYGRIDQTEPLDIAGAPEAVFAFDVVDARWPPLAPNQPFDLSDAPRILGRQRAFWSRMFRYPLGKRPEDPFRNAPIFRIEVTARLGDNFFDQLSHLSEEDWVRIELAPTGNFEVDVYGGLFAAPVTAYLELHSTGLQRLRCCRVDGVWEPVDALSPLGRFA